MSLSCQIHASNPNDGIFQPGDFVSGTIKYQIYELTSYSRITVSLKGKGVLDNAGVLDNRRLIEKCVNIEDVILQGDLNIAIGTYEAPFCFQLPTKIPPSFECTEICNDKVIRCRIFYYIHIKFEKPRTLQSGKNFKKDITVGVRVTPKLSRQPVKIVRWKNSSLPDAVYTVALIQSSVFSPGGKIRLLYNIINETSWTLSGVVIKLMEVLIFRPNRPLLKTKCYKTMDETIIRSPPINARGRYDTTVTILIPEDCKGTLGYSSLVARNYHVSIVIETPSPQSDICYNIPVEIGKFNTNIASSASSSSSTESIPTSIIDAPPSYWDIMGEDSNDVESDDTGNSQSIK